MSRVTASQVALGYYQKRANVNWFNKHYIYLLDWRLTSYLTKLKSNLYEGDNLNELIQTKS